MKLVDKIVELAHQYLTETNDWYSWKTINAAYLPAGVTLGIGNQYLQNIELKRQLHQLLKKDSTEENKLKVIKYYIGTWGGVRSNKATTLWLYASSHPETLISLGRKGVASWSKALCIYDPDRYAIFDARVSLSLNLLQLNEVNNPEFFPALLGQNRLINAATQRAKQLAISRNWIIIPDQGFYLKYLSVLTEASKITGAPIYTLEMLLFSLAPTLAAELLD